jgi:hypothetical protein
LTISIPIILLIISIFIFNESVPSDDGWSEIVKFRRTRYHPKYGMTIEEYIKFWSSPIEGLPFYYEEYE